MSWLPLLIVILVIAGMFLFGHDHGNTNRYKH